MERLLDYIVKEMCLISEGSLCVHLSDERVCQLSANERLDFYMSQFDQLATLKCRLNKRVQLLEHFIANPGLERSSLLKRIVAHLERQKQRNFLFCDEQALETSVKEKLFAKIQHLLLYNIYLEENAIINFISNPHRLFSSFYYQIDIPTEVGFKLSEPFLGIGQIE